MCGIIGFNWEDKKLIRKMMKVVEHRGPDQSGYYTDKNISLGHQRLSIIDLSDKGKQPMSNENGNLLLIYNGEIYNFKELRKELERKGHRFKSNTDSEVILHAYEEYEEKCLERFNGMFAFCLYDINKKIFFLARDKVGIKPLYYYFKDNKFIFASEIKAILEHSIKREINLDSLNKILSFRIIPGEDSILKDIKKLLPGHYLVYKDNKIEINGYDVNLDYNKNFLDLFEDSVKKEMIADVPIGAFLSGGLDSSSIVGMMSKISNNVRTFTAGFNQERDEFKYAKRVAEYFGTDHYEVLVDYDDMNKNFDKILYHMDEPILNPAIFPVYFVSKLAKKGVKVVLTGDGADELFAGYTKYNILKYPKFVPNMIKREIYIRYADRIFKKEKKSLLKFQVNDVNNIIRNYFYEKSNINGGLSFDFKESLPNFELMKVDKMTMANSLEARVPFLDMRIVKFSEKLNENEKLKNKVGKYFLRQNIKDIIPKEIIEGNKRTFFTPQKEWFNNGLREIASNDLEKSELFNKEFIKKLFEKEKNSFRRYKYSNQLWCLLIIEKWHSKWIEK